MPLLHHSNSFRTIAILSMVSMLLSACTSWQPISLQSGTVPYHVRVTTESERFELKAGHLVGDTAIAGLRMVRDDITPPRSIRMIDIQLLGRRCAVHLDVDAINNGKADEVFAEHVAPELSPWGSSLRLGRVLEQDSRRNFTSANP